MPPSSESSTFKDVSIIMATSGVTTLNVFINGALTVALPTIGKDLHFKEADLQWPLSAYALSYGCLLLFFGRVGDIVGGRTMFILGSCWFAVWSIATAFAPTDTTFILFVALLGLGAAANTPAGIRLLTSHFPPGTRRNQAFGVLGAGQPIGFILGLVLGGILTQSAASWRAIFYVQAALALAFTALGWTALRMDARAAAEEKRYTKGVDWGGAGLSTAGVALLTYSLADSTTAQHGWRSPHIPSLFSASLLLLGVFVWYERRREARGRSVLMPPSMWRTPRARMGSLVALVFFAWFSFNGLNYFLTLYFQQVKLLDPMHTALYFVPMTVAGFAVNLATGYAMSRVSGQYLILLGLVGSVAAPLIFGLMSVDASYWATSFLITILIVGADVAYPIGNLHVCAAFDDDSQSLAGGLFNVATRIGTSIGLAITSSVASSVSAQQRAHHPELAESDPAVLMPGFRAAAWVCLGTSALAFGIALVRLRGMGVVGAAEAVEAAMHTAVGVVGDDSEPGVIEEVKAHAPVPVLVPALVSVTAPGDGEKKSKDGTGEDDVTDGVGSDADVEHTCMRSQSVASSNSMVPIPIPTLQSMIAPPPSPPEASTDSKQNA